MSTLRDLWEEFVYHTQGLREGLAFLLTVAFPVAVLVAAFLLLMFQLVDGHHKAQCANYQEMTSIETRYLPGDQCYLKIDGQWMPYEEHLARLRSKQ